MQFRSVSLSISFSCSWRIRVALLLKSSGDSFLFFFYAQPTLRRQEFPSIKCSFPEMSSNLEEVPVSPHSHDSRQRGKGKKRNETNRSSYVGMECSKRLLSFGQNMRSLFLSHCLRLPSFREMALSLIAHFSFPPMHVPTLSFPRKDNIGPCPSDKTELARLWLLASLLHDIPFRFLVFSLLFNQFKCDFLAWASQSWMFKGTLRNPHTSRCTNSKTLWEWSLLK